LATFVPYSSIHKTTDNSLGSVLLHHAYSKSCIIDLFCNNINPGINLWPELGFHEPGYCSSSMIVWLCPTVAAVKEQSQFGLL